MSPHRHSMVRIGAAAFVLAVLCVFVVRGAIEGSKGLSVTLVRGHWLELALSASAVMAAILLLAVSWATNVAAIDTRAAPRRLRLVTIFALTWPVRYVPGTLPFLAGRVYVASRAGFETRSLAMATAFQGALEVVAATAYGLLFLALATAGAGDWRAWAAVLALGAGAFAALHPRMAPMLLERAGRVLGRSGGERWNAIPDSRSVAIAALCIIGCQSFVTLALVATSSAVTQVDAGDVPAIAAAAALSGVAGVLMVLAPAGLGVRDGVLAVLLATVMPAEDAATVALAYRGVTVVADIAVAVLALGADRAAALISGDGGDATAAEQALAEGRA